MSDDSVTTWRDLLREAMEGLGDPGPVVAYAPDEAAFGIEFSPGYGLAEGPAMLAWTATRVYFPLVDDGREWLGSAPRDPQAAGQKHLGGE
ncbi:hypothetical protein [Melissospora conviva]|uniref:hypothetical protein n=1 Tax=Melissospora conviva TaxID=3388432 RepID=UPI003C1B178E